MLHIILTLFSLQVFASAPISPELRTCFTNYFNRSGFEYSAQQRLIIGQGQRAFDSRIRQSLMTARPADYTKHTQATRSVDEARRFSLREAQYLPTIQRETLEANALRNMTGYTREVNGTLYKYVKFDKSIGFDQGQETQWLRVELSNGFYHGHPITGRRLREQCSECIP